MEGQTIEKSNNVINNQSPQKQKQTLTLAGFDEVLGNRDLTLFITFKIQRCEGATTTENQSQTQDGGEMGGS